MMLVAVAEKAWFWSCSWISDELEETWWSGCLSFGLLGKYKAISFIGSSTGL